MPENRLTLTDVCFSYPGSPEDPPVFDSLSAEVSLERPAVVFGANASGKTTLARLLSGLDTPDRGKAIRHLRQRPPGRGRVAGPECGVVFEQPDFQLHTPTVRDELTTGLAHLGATPAARDRALELAETGLGLSGLFDRPVQSLETGEKLAVLTASFLLLEVDLLVLDFSLAALQEGFRSVLLDTVCAPGGPSLLVLTRNAWDLLPAGPDSSCWLLEHGRLERLGQTAQSPALLGRLERAGIRLPWYVKTARDLHGRGLLDRVFFASEAAFLEAIEQIPQDE